MEAIRLMTTASEGKLTVSVPEEFNNKEVEVIVLLQPATAKDDSMEELHRKRMELVGTAKYPDFPISKYDVYNQ